MRIKIILVCLVIAVSVQVYAEHRERITVMERYPTEWGFSPKREVFFDRHEHNLKVHRDKSQRITPCVLAPSDSHLENVHFYLWFPPDTSIDPDHKGWLDEGDGEYMADLGNINRDECISSASPLQFKIVKSGVIHWQVTMRNLPSWSDEFSIQITE